MSADASTLIGKSNSHRFERSVLTVGPTCSLQDFVIAIFIVVCSDFASTYGVKPTWDKL